MLGLVFSVFCSNHQKAIETKRCHFSTTLQCSKSGIGVWPQIGANCQRRGRCFYFMPVLVSQWTLLTGISGVCKKAIEALCAINASPFIWVWLEYRPFLTKFQLWPCCNTDGCWDPFSHGIPSSPCSFSTQSHSRDPKVKAWKISARSSFQIPFPTSTPPPGSN